MRERKIHAYVRHRCPALKVAYREIMGKDRTARVARARLRLMWEVRNEFGYSFEVIGQAFGGRHHTTAIHAYQRIEDEAYTDRKRAIQRRTYERRISA